MATRPTDEAIMGLYVWVKRQDDSEAEADKAIQWNSKDLLILTCMLTLTSIVAVQGLGASPYFTWVKKVRMGSQEVKEVMWLKDLLPNHVPSARIATFSYLSDWYTYQKGVKTSLRRVGRTTAQCIASWSAQNQCSSHCTYYNWF